MSDLLALVVGVVFGSASTAISLGVRHGRQESKVSCLITAAQQWRDTDETDDVAMYLACYALQEALMEVENA